MKSLSKTPAPPKDRIVGSKINPKGSASSEKSAKDIKLSADILVSLTKKLKEFKEQHPSVKNVGLSDLKAVYRRGLGAYSKTHRPTISGGKPNTRNAWAMARVNEFLEKASGKKVKKAYVQDDDLLKYEDGGLLAPNGKKSNLTPEQYKLVRTPEFKAWFGDWENDPENASKVVDENGEPLVMYHGSTSIKPYYTFDKNFININDPDFWCNGFWFALDIKETNAWTELGGEKYVRSFFLNVRKILSNENIDNYENEYYDEIEENNGTQNRYKLIERGYDGVEFVKIINIYNQVLRDYINRKEVIEIDKKLKLVLDKIDDDNVYVLKENGQNIDSIYIDTFKGKKLDDSYFDFAKQIIQNLTKSGVVIVFKPEQIKLADGTNTTFDSNNPDIRYDKGGEVDKFIEDGIVELKMYDTKPEHAKIYGFDAQKPLYIQTIIVSEGHRGKGIGSKVMEYIVDYANKNGHDVIFGNITQKAEPSVDVIKSMLVKSGFNTIEGNDDFYKVMYNNGGEVNENFTPIFKWLDMGIEQDDGSIKYVHSNNFFFWIYDDKNSLKKLESGIYEYAYPTFDFGNDLERIWKDFEQYKGNEHIIGFVVGSTLDYFEKEGYWKLYIEIMTTRPSYRRKGVNEFAIKYLRDKFKLKKEQVSFVDPTEQGQLFIDSMKYADGGEIDDHKETYKKWKSLVNMSYSELESFYNSKEGKEAGLSSSEAKAQGIDSGRESARWIMKMKSTPKDKWTPTMWKWAKKQISFISRMSGNEGKLYDDKGNKTRKHTSLLIWGHNPKKESSMKYAKGGVTDNSVINEILELVKPYQDEMTQKWIEAIEKEGKIKLNHFDIEYYKFGLVVDLVKALGKYIEDGDTIKNVSVNRGRQDLVIISSIIVRDGKEYPFSTEVIYAGGYNIQKLHIRYIVHTKLPYAKSNKEYDKMNEEYKKMTKAQKIREDIGYAENIKKRNELKLEEAKENAKLSDEEVEKISRNDEREKDSWRVIDTTWEEIVSRGADKNYDYDENYFYGEMENYKKSKIDFWRRINANVKQYEDAIKRENKEIEKLNKKLSELGVDKMEDGGVTKDIRKFSKTGSFKYILINAKRTNNFAKWSNKKESLEKEIEFIRSASPELADELKIFETKIVETDYRTRDKYGTWKNTFYSNFEIDKMEGGGMIAPNGKHSNLTPEQYKLVRTPEFKAWFGDWENDPENSSKVVDENGEPLVVYHGSRTSAFREIDIFIVGDGAYGKGIYFTSNRKEAEGFSLGNFIYECFVNIKNPFVETYYRKYKPYLIEENQDGIIVKDLNLVYWSIAFTPEQIKLADGTNTTFDSNNPDIRYADGGMIEFDGRFQKDLEKLLKVEGWQISYYDKNVNEVPKDVATNISVFRFEPYYESISIKLPTKMNVTFDWIMNKVNSDKVYKSFSDNFNKLLQAKGYGQINAYPTTYGIGVFVGFGKDIDETKQNIENLLNSLGIEYTTEYSDAYYIFRYKISKSKSNIEKINAISDKFADGGEINLENFDWSSIYNIDEEELKREAIKRQEDEREQWYQKSSWSKKYAPTYKDAVNKTLENYIKAKETFDDWSSREYKQNKSMVYLGGNDVFGEAKSIGSINEGRRQRVLRGAKMTMDESLSDLKELGLSEKEISDLINENKYAKGGELRGLSHAEIDTKVHIISKKFKVPIEYITEQLKLGVKFEMEHTSDKSIASKIALDHLNESPLYYQKLKEMEKELETIDHDKYLPRLMSAYANGGEIDMIYKLNTPTKQPTKLNYIQQVLVRTTEFKKWFGDWEKCAENFLETNREDFIKSYQGCSVVVDLVTLEPQVVYHGTNYKEEFYKFDVTKEQGIGRPYGYFADNIEYSQNFTTSSQRGQHGKELLYKCFLNIKKPFFAIEDFFLGVSEDSMYWTLHIARRLNFDMGKDIDSLPDTINLVQSQIGNYLRATFQNDKAPFWRLMSRDSNKDFKYFLMSHGYDGIRYGEEFSFGYNINIPSEFTKAWTIFDAIQVKLADGRNIDFDPMNVDIRYEDGGSTDIENQETKTDMQMEHNSKSHEMRSKLGIDKFAEGGSVKGDGKHTNDAKKGGFFDGRSHAEGGIKAINKDTGQMLEVEGNEVIINKRSVADDTKREFEGKMMTNREILSKINEMGGGVKFADGGEVDEKSCKCMGKRYKFGGELVTDFDIVKQLTSVGNAITKPINSSIVYVEGLIKRMSK